MKLVHPEEVGFSSQRLTRLNSRMQRYVDDGQIAGIISLVARLGHVIHFEKVGMAHMDAASRDDRARTGT